MATGRLGQFGPSRLILFFAVRTIADDRPKTCLGELPMSSVSGCEPTDRSLVSRFKIIDTLPFS